MTQLVPRTWKATLSQLRDAVHRIIDRWSGRRRAAVEEDRPLPAWLVSGGPLIDLEESDDDILVIAELPGLTRDDFAVEVTADRLTLRGKKERIARSEGEGYFYSERSGGAFLRTIDLPCDVDPDKAKAEYRQGLLRVTLPKTEQAKSRRIRVRVE
ncbi:MAG TPA: Hsp20/alpha crystallin family protein [Candidatus Acidoferrales bacterium]|nr:Hsp20/alpha crystallin family protein [Candidatus Acidoferrales bacterium]